MTNIIDVSRNCKPRTNEIFKHVVANLSYFISVKMRKKGLGTVACLYLVSTYVLHIFTFLISTSEYLTQVT